MSRSVLRSVVVVAIAATLLTAGQRAGSRALADRVIAALEK